MLYDDTITCKIFSWVWWSNRDKKSKSNKYNYSPTVFFSLTPYSSLSLHFFSLPLESFTSLSHFLYTWIIHFNFFNVILFHRYLIYKYTESILYEKLTIAIYFVQLCISMYWIERLHIPCIIIEEKHIMCNTDFISSNGSSSWWSISIIM